MPSGLVVVDKPAGLTSHDVVPGCAAGPHPRVGHAGTLDPMATGVLVIGVEAGDPAAAPSRADRQGLHRDDPARAATVTDDAEGEVVGAASAAGPAAEAAVAAALAALTGGDRAGAQRGQRDQGRRPAGYDRVRAGEEVELPARPVTVRALRGARVRPARPTLLDVDVEVDCSSGTYVRAMARDSGPRSASAAT